MGEIGRICGVVGCDNFRDDYRLWCTDHIDEYNADVIKQGGATVIDFVEAKLRIELERSTEK